MEDPDLLRHVAPGWSVMVFRGRRYGVTRTAAVGGRVGRIYAEELGGTDVVSANVYHAASDHGVRLRPCEMPAEKVLAFLRDAVPDTPRDGLRAGPGRERRRVARSADIFSGGGVLAPAPQSTVPSVPHPEPDGGR